MIRSVDYAKLAHHLRFPSLRSMAPLEQVIFWLILSIPAISLPMLVMFFLGMPFLGWWRWLFLLFLLLLWYNSLFRNGLELRLNRSDFLLLGLVVLSLLVQIVLSLQSLPVTWDGAAYLLNAKYMRGETALFSPHRPQFLPAYYAVVGTETLNWKLGTGFISFLMPLAVYLCAFQLSGSRLAGVTAGLASTASPLYLMRAGIPMADILTALLLLAILVQVFDLFAGHPKHNRWLWLGITITAAMHTKFPNSLVLLVWVPLFYRSRNFTNWMTTIAPVLFTSLFFSYFYLIHYSDPLYPIHFQGYSTIRIIGEYFGNDSNIKDTVGAEYYVNELSALGLYVLLWLGLLAWVLVLNRCRARGVPGILLGVAYCLYYIFLVAWGATRYFIFPLALSVIAIVVALTTLTEAIVCRMGARKSDIWKYETAVLPFVVAILLLPSLLVIHDTTLPGLEQAGNREQAIRAAVPDLVGLPGPIGANDPYTVSYYTRREDIVFLNRETPNFSNYLASMEIRYIYSSTHTGPSWVKNPLYLYQFSYIEPLKYYHAPDNQGYLWKVNSMPAEETPSGFSLRNFLEVSDNRSLDSTANFVSDDGRIVFFGRTGYDYVLDPQGYNLAIDVVIIRNDPGWEQVLGQFLTASLPEATISGADGRLYAYAVGDDRRVFQGPFTEMPSVISEPVVFRPQDYGWGEAAGRHLLILREVNPQP